VCVVCVYAVCVYVVCVYVVCVCVCCVRVCCVRVCLTRLRMHVCEGEYVRLYACLFACSSTVSSSHLPTVFLCRGCIIIKSASRTQPDVSHASVVLVGLSFGTLIV